MDGSLAVFVLVRQPGLARGNLGAKGEGCPNVSGERDAAKTV